MHASNFEADAKTQADVLISQREEERGGEWWAVEINEA